MDNLTTLSTKKLQALLKVASLEEAAEIEKILARRDAIKSEKYLTNVGTVLSFLGFLTGSKFGVLVSLAGAILLIVANMLLEKKLETFNNNTLKN